MAASGAVLAVWGNEEPRAGILAQIRGDRNQVSESGNQVSESEIARAPGGLAERAVLRWFQAGQFSDVAAVRTWTARKELRRVGARRLAHAVKAQGKNLGRPEIVSVRKRGSRRIVRVLALGPPDVEPLSAIPVTLETVFEQGRWKVADVRYLLALDRSTMPSGR